MTLADLRAAHEAAPCDVEACVAFLRAVAEAPCEWCAGRGQITQAAVFTVCSDCDGTGKGGSRAVEALLSATESYGPLRPSCPVLPALRLLAEWERDWSVWNGYRVWCRQNKTVAALDCLLTALSQVGIVAGICARCGRPSEAHDLLAVWNPHMWCPDEEQEYRYQRNFAERRSPLSCPLPKEAR